jgi:hypothetical protein
MVWIQLTQDGNRLRTLWKFEFHKYRKGSWLAERLLAFHKDSTEYNWVQHRKLTV